MLARRAVTQLCNTPEHHCWGLASWWQGQVTKYVSLAWDERLTQSVDAITLDLAQAAAQTLALKL
jgi:hypothetical protein